jgi:RNA polymerase sigma-70 factor (ECF subfamily)
VDVENLSAYLFSAIKYKVISHLEKVISRRVYAEAQLHSLALVENSTEETVYLNELNLALEKEIQKLPPKRQQIFKLSRQGHLSIKASGVSFRHFRKNG